MHRRLALTALAAVIATPALLRSALAENAPSSASQTSGNAAATIGEAEAKHAADTMAIGSMSLATSRIAAKKAEHAKVKEFAQFEIAEQDTIADILTSMKDQSAPVSGKVKPPSDAEVQAALDAKGKKAVAEFEGMKVGKAFDHAYVKEQIEGHQKLLEIQEAYLAAGKDRENINVAKLARGQIKEHLKLLADLEKEIGRG